MRWAHVSDPCGQCSPLKRRGESVERNINKHKVRNGISSESIELPTYVRLVDSRIRCAPGECAANTPRDAVSPRPSSGFGMSVVVRVFEVVVIKTTEATKGKHDQL